MELRTEIVRKRKTNQKMRCRLKTEKKNQDQISDCFLSFFFFFIHLNGPPRVLMKKGLEDVSY